MDEHVAVGFFDELNKMAGLFSRPKPPSFGQRARRVLTGAGMLMAGTYGLGRGLEAGVASREAQEKEEANRSARFSGARPPYV